MNDFDFDKVFDDGAGPEATPAATLDLIRKGGEKLVFETQTRILAAQEALAAGKFDQCLHRIDDARHYAEKLSAAQGFLGTAAETITVRAEDLQEGHILVGWGRVESIEVKENPQAAGMRHATALIKIEGEEEPRRLNADRDMYVLPETEEV